MSVRLIVLSALSAASVLPAVAPAQERQSVPRPKVFFDDQEPQVIRDRIRAITQRRARLGVSVDMVASDADSIGTPNTGNGVSAAATPARCAAPPAAAMMTCKPRASALLHHSNARWGVRCALMTRFS